MNYIGRYTSEKYIFSVDNYCDILGCHITVEGYNVEKWILEENFIHYIRDGQIKKIDTLEPNLFLPKFSFNHTS